MARLASDADYEAVVATIVDAFHRDPLWSWICPDPLRRREQHAEIFGLYVESALPNGGVWMTDAQASAAAVFTPPGRRELSEEAESQGWSRSSGERSAGTRRRCSKRSSASRRQPRRASPLLPELLGTKPAARGHGLGMALLAELVEQADREGHPTYLESTNPANNPRYERLGFEAQSRFSTPDDLHNVTTMWREPR